MPAEVYEFWLMGVPTQSKAKDFERLRKLTKKNCALFEFSVPNLRIGTLDLLFQASTDLYHLQKTITGLLVSQIQRLEETIQMDAEQMKQNVLVENRPMPQFLHKFHWKDERFPIDRPIFEHIDYARKQVLSSAEESQKQMTEYSSVKKQLDALERAQKGSLLTRNISQILKRDDFVLNSTNLVTVVVVVYKERQNEWLNQYELLDDEVVPRSSKLIYQEGDFCLFNVTLFRRKLKDFMGKARELRFFVRDVSYNEDLILSELTALKDLQQEKQSLEKPLIRLFKTMFSDSYITLTHVYSMRLFVESILRFGLPLSYLYIFAVVPKNQLKKVRKFFNKEFAHLDRKSDELEESKKKRQDKTAGPTPLQMEYYPYVFIKLRSDISHFRQ